MILTTYQFSGIL